MRSRERVLAALNHIQPDRVPVDFGAHRSSGIMAIAYAKLKETMGISSGAIYVYDMVQQLAVVEPEVLDAFGVDDLEMILSDTMWTGIATPGAHLGLSDAGLDTFNPVQITCAGMDAEHLKRTYGDRMALWGGGCDTRDILINGTPQQIREHVRDQIRIFHQNGGFIFQQVHNIMADVPPQNIIAMFEAVGSA